MTTHGLPVGQVRALGFEVPDPVTISYRLVVSRADSCAELLYQPYP